MAGLSKAKMDPDRKAALAKGLRKAVGKEKAESDPMKLSAAKEKGTLEKNPALLAALPLVGPGIGGALGGAMAGEPHGEAGRGAIRGGVGSLLGGVGGHVVGGVPGAVAGSPTLRAVGSLAGALGGSYLGARTALKKYQTAPTKKETAGDEVKLSAERTHRKGAIRRLHESRKAQMGIGGTGGAIGGALLAARKGKTTKEKLLRGAVGALGGGLAGTGFGALSAKANKATYRGADVLRGSKGGS
jgi:hypothetical protein